MNYIDSVIKINITVVGGASKLLNHLEKIINPVSLISYANRRWSQGDLYEKIGFDYINVTEPNFFWFNGDYKLHSRMKFQKHKLQKTLKFYDESLSTKDILFKNGSRIIYDSGNKKYIKKYKKTP